MPKTFLNHILGKILLTILVGFNVWYLFKKPLESIEEAESQFLIKALNCLVLIILSFLMHKQVNYRKIAKSKGIASLILISLLVPFIIYLNNFHSFNLIYLLLVLKWYIFFKIYNQTKIWSESFLISFIIGLMSLVKFELFILLPIFWVGIFMIRTFAWRNVAFSIIGFLLPWTYALSYYYLFDKMITPPEIEISSFDLSYINAQKSILFVTVLLALIIELGSSKSTGVHQQKQMKYLMINIFILFVLGLFVSFNYIIIAFPLALIIIESNYIKTDKKWIYELALTLLLSINIVEFYIF